MNQVFREYLLSQGYTPATIDEAFEWAEEIQKLIEPADLAYLKYLEAIKLPEVNIYTSDRTSE